jgi:hypothetical protein
MIRIKKRAIFQNWKYPGLGAVTVSRAEVDPTPLTNFLSVRDGRRDLCTSYGDPG